MHIEDCEDMENFVAFFKDLGQPGLEDFRGAFTERVAERGIYTESPAFTVRDAQDRAIAIELMKELAQPDMADLKEAMLARLRGRRIAHPVPPPAAQPQHAGGIRSDCPLYGTAGHACSAYRVHAH